MSMLRKRNKISSSLVYVFHKTLNKAFSRRSRAKTAKECTGTMFKGVTVVPYNFSHDNIMALLLVNKIEKGSTFLFPSKTRFTTWLFITSILVKKNLPSPSLPRFSCFPSSLSFTGSPVLLFSLLF